MTENLNKVLRHLTEKRLADKRSGSINPGWITAKDLAAQCGFTKVGTAVGCIVTLMNKGIVEKTDNITPDGKIRKYYRIRADVNLTVTYSFEDNLSAKRNVVW